MRWLLITVIVLLFELLSYGAARSLLWAWSAYITPVSARVIFWAMLIISHGFLIAAITRLFPLALKASMTWLAVLWMMILAAALTYVLHWLCRNTLHDWLITSGFSNWGTAVLFTGLTLALLGRAIFNAYMPTVRHLTIQTDKQLTAPLRLAMVSDLHLGRLIGNRELNLLHDIVKREKVHVLLMPGDIFDDEPSEFHARHMQPTLQRLIHDVPLGVYATLGNHDLYGHREANTAALRASGVTVLDDQCVQLREDLWLIGRLDDHVRNRQPTAALVPPTDGRFRILMDHEPSQIVQNGALPLDLQLSGHTHNGQIFPANFIVNRMYKVAYGHAKVNHLDVVVSSGYGFWGVPFRLGSRSEVWVIDVIPKA